jgi:hypothetical protein
MRRQSLALQINGRLLGERDLKLGVWSAPRWLVPAGWLRPGINCLVLRSAWSISPHAAGLNPDLRLLSVQVRRLRFSRQVWLVNPEAADALAGAFLEVFPIAAIEGPQLEHRLECFRRLEKRETAQAWQKVTLQLERLHDLLRRQDVPWLLAALPDPLQLEPSEYEALLVRRGWAPEGLDLDQPQRRLREWAAAHGVPFLDLRSELAGAAGNEEPWDQQIGGWRYAARRRAAARIAAELPGALREPL